MSYKLELSIIKSYLVIILLIFFILYFSIISVAEDYRSQLFMAIEQGEYDLVEDLIDDPLIGGPKVGVNEKNFDGMTPLIASSMLGRNEISKLLIDNGANINSQDELGNTALIYASGVGNLESVKLLLENNAEMNIRNNNDINALLMAITIENKENYKTNYKELMKMAEEYNQESEFGQNIETAKFLIEKGADVSDNVVLISSKLNKQEIINKLSDTDFNFDSKENATNALINAIKHKNINMIEDLIDCGADPNSNLEDNKETSMTVFDLVFKNNSNEIIKTMIDGGGNVNSEITLKENSESIKVPMLISAIAEERIEIAKLLIDEGADVEVKIDGASIYTEGTNALLLSVKKNQMSTVKELVGGIIFSPKANINSVDSLGNNALIYAIKDNNYEMTKYLIDKGAEVNSSNNNEETPLILAIKNQNVKIIDLLIKNNADLKYENSNGKTLLDYAKEQEKEEVVITIEAAILAEKKEEIDKKNKTEDGSIFDSIKSGVDSVKSKAKDIID